MAAAAKDEQRGGYIGLRDLTTPGILAEKRKTTEQLRGVLKREWALNREYNNGNQWSFWNSQMLRVESMPADAGPAGKVRLQSNQIKPGLASFVAQLIKTRPTIYAEPNSAGDTDVKSAQMATSLFESLFEDLGLNSKAAEALYEAGLSGGYWLVSWDTLAGKPMTFTLGPDGQPIMDDELAEVFIDQLTEQAEQAGHDPQEVLAVAKKTVYLGDISVKVMMAENVLLDPGAASFDDCKWAICRHSMDPDEIQARWGKYVPPNASKSTDVPLAFANVEERKPVATVREVFIMYTKPCPALPDGRYVVWVEGPDMILQDMKWPWKHRFLPLVKFPGLYRPDSPYDDPVVSEARPMQKDLNKTLSQFVEHKNITVRPQMLAPQGSLRQKLTSEPGAVIEFNPVMNMIPQWREIPNLPPWLFEHLNGLQGRIDRVFNRIPSSRDQIPARADGGGLLEAMQEATSDQISTIIMGLEDALARAGNIMASLAQQYYAEPRLMRIRGTGGSVQVKKFEAADIEGGFTFKPRYGTGLPRTRQGKLDAIIQLVQEQILTPQQALKELELGSVKAVQNQLMADEDQAFREHDKILRGQPINEGALQDAQNQLQQFQQQAQQIVEMLTQGKPVDLDQDGQPDDPQQVLTQLQQQMQELQQQLQQAPWQPLDFENWEQHVETHGTYMKSPEFERLPPQAQAIFIQHYNLTYQRLIEVRMAMPDANHKTSVNVRAMATVSAPTMAKILSKSGIDSPAQEVSQPPLDTAVIDSLNQPKADGSGNDPLTQLDQAVTTQQAQDAHVTAQADAAQKMGLAEERAAQAQARHDMEMQGLVLQQQQLEEQHQAKLQAMKQQGKG
jgi:hypothetical protein